MFNDDTLAAIEAARIRSRSRLIAEGRTTDGYFAVYQTPEDSYPTVMRHKATIGVDYWFTKSAALIHVAEYIKHYA
jgi:hypothetical protein|nr:MAG TPA: hypothetical protein [Caudoviricetes sp.]